MYSSRTPSSSPADRLKALLQSSEALVDQNFSPTANDSSGASSANDRDSLPSPNVDKILLQHKKEPVVAWTTGAQSSGRSFVGSTANPPARRGGAPVDEDPYDISLTEELDDSDADGRGGGRGRRSEPPDPARLSPKRAMPKDHATSAHRSGVGATLRPVGGATSSSYDSADDRWAAREQERDRDHYSSLEEAEVQWAGRGAAAKHSAGLRAARTIYY